MKYLFLMIFLVACDMDPKDMTDVNTHYYRLYDKEFNVICYQSKAVSAGMSCVKLEGVTSANPGLLWIDTKEE